jgi:hypothetical protein
MKKGIEVFQDYDSSRRWRLVIEKKRGKLTLDEIKETARDYEWDFYLLVLDCFHEEDEVPYGYEVPKGDRVELYRTDLFYEEGER